MTNDDNISNRIGLMTKMEELELDHETKRLVQRNIDCFKMMIEEKQFHPDIARCFFRLEMNYDPGVIDFVEENYKIQNPRWKDFYLKAEQIDNIS